VRQGFAIENLDICKTMLKTKEKSRRIERRPFSTECSRM
jgi:hypothetical protein